MWEIFDFESGFSLVLRYSSLPASEAGKKELWCMHWFLSFFSVSRLASSFCSWCQLVDLLLLKTEVKHQVYVKRQTQIRTTWPTFLFTCRLLFIISTPKLVVSRNFLFIRIAFELFYLLFFYFEKFSTRTGRFPFAVYVKLKLSNDKITKDCFTNNKMNFEKQLDWQVLEKKDNCNPLHSSSSLSIRASFSSGGSRRRARGAQVPPPHLFFEPNCLHSRSKFQ